MAAVFGCLWHSQGRQSCFSIWVPPGEFHTATKALHGGVEELDSSLANQPAFRDTIIWPALNGYVAASELDQAEAEDDMMHNRKPIVVAMLKKLIAVISNATGQNFTTTNSGSYAVELTLNGCVDTSNCVAVTILTATFMEDGNQVRLYPNPTSSDVTIDFDRIQKSIRLRLFDSIGRLIQTKSYQDIRDIRLQMPLFSGVYMVELNSENGRAVFQIIKE